MQITSKEHYEMMENFERNFKNEGRMDREPKALWPTGSIYEDGQINNLFKAFRFGVSYQLGLQNT